MVVVTGFRPMRTAFVGGAHKVFMKLVVDAASRRVLGIDAWPSLVGDAVHLDIAIEAVRSGDSTKEDTP